MKYDETRKMKYDSRKCLDTIPAETLFEKQHTMLHFKKQKYILRDENVILHC